MSGTTAFGDITAVSTSLKGSRYGTLPDSVTRVDSIEWDFRASGLSGRHGYRKRLRRPREHDPNNRLRRRCDDGSSTH